MKLKNRSSLRVYQHKAIEFIKNNRSCALWLDMGLGKTVSTLTALSDLIASNKAKRILIIAPLYVAKTVWGKEIESWEHLRHLRYSLCTGDARSRLTGIKSDADIYVINRENVKWLYDAIVSLKLPWFDTIVIDEASSFKNHRSERFKALKSFAYNRMIELTGTPSPNGLMDLWPQIYLLDNGQRLGKYISNYRDKFFYKEYYTYYIIDPTLIYDKVKDLVLSMKSEDYIELPDIIYNTIPVTLGNYREYKYFESNFVLKSKDIEAQSAAVLSNKLLQYCNGAVYDEDGTVIDIHNEKLDVLKDIVENNETENFIVVYNFKFDRDRILQTFDFAKTLDSKDSVEEWNNRKIRMLLIHPATGGAGLNLQNGGNNIIWFGLTWNLEHYLQMNKRLHRHGQEKPVVITHIVAKDTREEKVSLALQNKNINQEELLSYLID